MSRPIVFVGSSALGLRTLVASPHFKAERVLCAADRLTQQLVDITIDRSLQLDVFNGYRAFRKLVEKQPTSMPFFIYQLDMLVPADLTETYAFYNVHRGNLFTNRGPNPDVWPILEGHTETSLSLHRIDAEVDAGLFIAARDVHINSDDDTLTVQARLEAMLPQLVESLHEFLSGRCSGTILHGGVYRPWIRESDFTIDLRVDSLDLIGRKIRSQRRYNGALIVHAEQKHYVRDVLEVRRRSGEEWYFLVEDSVIRTRSYSHDLVLARNSNPAFPAPPLRRASLRV